jgi:hypothetical protein
MNKIFVICFAAAMWLLLSGCGAKSGESSAHLTKTRRSSAANATNRTESANTSAGAPQTDPALSQANAAEPPVNNAPVPGSPEDIKGGKMKMLRGPVNMQPNSAPPPKPITQLAPDNSEYSIVLTDVAIETRTFRNHSQLLKVEKRSDGKQTAIKVYLKDGRVVDIPGNRIETLGTISAAGILAAAGLQPAGQAVQRPSKQKSPAVNPQ